MRSWYLSHRRPAKAQASLRIRAVLPEHSLFAHMKYGCKRMIRPNIRHLAPLAMDGWACAFEEWVYGGRKEPLSHDMTQIIFQLILAGMPWRTKSFKARVCPGCWKSYFVACLPIYDRPYCFYMHSRNNFKSNIYFQAYHKLQRCHKLTLT